MKRKIYLIIFIFLLLFFPVFAELYDIKELFTISWDEADSGVSYQSSFDKVYGPSSFFVDVNSNIYILDTLQKKIKKFNPSIKKLESLNIVLPSEFFYDFVVNNGQIFVRTLKKSKKFFTKIVKKVFLQIPAIFIKPLLKIKTTAY